MIVNKYLKSKTVDEMIEENRKKAQKKREKKGTLAKEINKMATTSTRNVGTSQRAAITDAREGRKAEKGQAMAKRQNREVLHPRQIS